MNYFVTGTDTSVGKTLVCAWLLSHLKADYWKPIQSGPEKDYDVIKHLTQLANHQIHQPTYDLTLPMSPNQAAAPEDIHIELEDFHLPHSMRPLIVEGAGGIMVPLNERDMVIDLIKHLDLPTILVARSGLGTLNHTLLTLEALHSRDIHVAGIILSGPPHEENVATLKQFTSVPIIGQLPQLSEISCHTLKSIPLNTAVLTQKQAA